jgi:CubicO group peptidase (beta-lactamase class C family)
MRLTAAAKILLVALCAFTPCLAQANIPRQIDNLVRSEMRARQIPGVAIAVVRNGKISLLKTYGFANIEHHVPIKPTTIFQSGSIGKQFTAAAIMILVQEGRLSLDDKLSKYFPDFPNSWNGITVRHLLTHTSGMGDYPPDIDLRRDYTEEQLLEYFKKAPLAFRPGEKWDYSNVGYVTLGILIRKITGKFYGDVLRERVFQPLGMTTARVISEAEIIANRAAGYRLVAGEIKNQEWVSSSTNSTADGSLYLSILDLAKWDAALYTDRPLRQTTLTQVWQPATLNSGVSKGYGFGWFSERFHNQRVVFHGGFWQGFKSCIMRFPDDKLTIIMLTNSSNTREFKLARGLAAVYFRQFRIPRALSVEDREPNVTLLMRRFLLQLMSDSFDKGLTTATLAAELTPARVKELTDRLNSLTLPIAIIHSEELIERRNENGLRVYRYLFNDIPRTLTLTLKVTKDDKIAAFELTEINL